LVRLNQAPLLPTLPDTPRLLRLIRNSPARKRTDTCVPPSLIGKKLLRLFAALRWFFASIQWRRNVRNGRWRVNRRAMCVVGCWCHRAPTR
jgi:hypothetical protein